MKQLIPVTLQNGPAQSGSYILMLLEPDSRRQVPIIVGSAEGQAILLAQQEVPTRRPMTHQLMARIMDTYGIHLTKVVIDHVNEGIFYSTLYLTDGFNEKTLDSRTTDAIAFALHCGAPILAEDTVIDETAIAAPTPTENKSKPTLQELEDELRRCEESEDYERAAELQKQIDHYTSQQ